MPSALKLPDNEPAQIRTGDLLDFEYARKPFGFWWPRQRDVMTARPRARVYWTEKEPYLNLFEKKKKKEKNYFLKLINPTITDKAPTMICIQGVPPVRSVSHTYNLGIRWTRPPMSNNQGAHFCISFAIISSSTSVAEIIVKHN